MTRVEANLLLDEIKNGINNYSNLAVTRALWITGDLNGKLSSMATFSGGKDDSSPSCHSLSVMTSANDEVRHDRYNANT